MQTGYGEHFVRVWFALAEPTGSVNYSLGMQTGYGDHFVRVWFCVRRANGKFLDYYPKTAEDWTVSVCVFVGIYVASSLQDMSAIGKSGGREANRVAFFNAI